MNRGKVTPKPQSGVFFGVTQIQQQSLAAVTPDRTTPGALVGCTGAPRSPFLVTNYQAQPWLSAVGA